MDSFATRRWVTLLVAFVGYLALLYVVAKTSEKYSALVGVGGLLLLLALARFLF